MNTYRKLGFFVVMLVVLVAGVVMNWPADATAQNGDPVESEMPGLNNFVSKVPDSYFQKQALRKLDWQLVKAGYAITATTEPAGVHYAGYAGSEQLERLVFQFIATDSFDQNDLAARMDALLKLRFPDIPADAWAYQVVTADGKTSHLCVDDKWTTETMK
jgi:hypothetical protein